MERDRHQKIATTVIEAMSTCETAHGWNNRLLSNEQHPPPSSPRSSSSQASCKEDQQKYHLAIKDISGYGGGTTYHIRILVDHQQEGREDENTPFFFPTDVCFHELEKDLKKNSQGRLELAQARLAAHGLAVPRLVTLEGSYIEHFAPVRPPPADKSSIAPPEPATTYAKLLGEIHKVPTDWFNDYRSEVLDSSAALKEATTTTTSSAGIQQEPVPENSHLWMYAARGCMPGVHPIPRSSSRTSSSALTATSFTAPTSAKWPAEAFSAFGNLGAVMPQHPVALRLVTCHGDFHRGNVLLLRKSTEMTEEEPSGVQPTTTPSYLLKEAIACDFEFTSVSAAVWDLGFALQNFWDTGERHLFLRTYLETIGSPEALATLQDPQSYQEFLLDVSLGVLPTWGGGPSHLIGWMIANRPAATVCSPYFMTSLVKRFAKKLRSSTALQNRLWVTKNGAPGLLKELKGSLLAEIAAEEEISVSECLRGRPRRPPTISKAIATAKGGSATRDVTSLVRSMFANEDCTLRIDKHHFSSIFSLFPEGSPAETLELYQQDDAAGEGEDERTTTPNTARQTMIRVSPEDRIVLKDGFPLSTAFFKAPPCPLDGCQTYEISPLHAPDMRLGLAMTQFEKKISGGCEDKVKNGARVVLVPKLKEGEEDSFCTKWKVIPRGGSSSSSWFIVSAINEDYALDIVGMKDRPMHLWQRWSGANENQHFYIYPRPKEQQEEGEAPLIEEGDGSRSSVRSGVCCCVIESVKIPGLLVDVCGGYSKPGSEIHLWDAHFGDNQQWNFIPTSTII